MSHTNDSSFIYKHSSQCMDRILMVGTWCTINHSDCSFGKRDDQRLYQSYIQFSSFSFDSIVLVFSGVTSAFPDIWLIPRLHYFVDRNSALKDVILILVVNFHPTCIVYYYSRYERQGKSHSFPFPQLVRFSILENKFSYSAYPVRFVT